MNYPLDLIPYDLVKVNFNVSEFIYDKNAPVPLDVLNAIVRYHLMPVNVARNDLGFPVIVSQSSGYRTVEHEKSMGRTGTSLHCFGTHIPKLKDRPEHYRKGAVDYTCSRINLEKLFLALIRVGYTRICFYPDKYFFHCDYFSDRPMWYEATPEGKWVQRRTDVMILNIRKAIA